MTANAQVPATAGIPTPRPTGRPPAEPGGHGPAVADPEVRWRQAGRALLAKMIGEFAYEGLLAPRPDADGWYRLTVRADAEAGPAVEYRLRADRGAYGCWFVDPASVRRAGHPATDPLAFVADARATLDLPGDTAGHLVRELAATLAADARIAATAILTAAELADLDHARLEGQQTGHPWIAFNKGRIGFSTGDTLRYAPESRQPLRLPWIAVRDDLAKYRAIPNLSARRLYTEELSPAARVRFGAELIRRGCNPARYWWLPIHPWQWDEIIQPLFGADLAASRMVYLGEGDDSYLAQQSISAFGNISVPHRRHVEVPLSILDTPGWRGLPAERTTAAPAVASWLRALTDADAFLSQECRVVLLGEVASVSVGHPVLDRIEGAPYQYRELLGAIWREPLPAALQDGERARTLAALLSFGADGRPLIGELVRRSGLEPRDWLARLFAAILPPLLHYLYAYGTAFSPHGENAVVIYDERDIPARLAVTDFVDGVTLADADLPELADLPAEVESVLPREEPAHLCRSLHGALFVGHLRYLARIGEQYLDVPAEAFWAAVKDTIRGYQERFPERAERYDLFDLGAPRIDRLCPNRNRLLVDGYRDRATRPHVEPCGTVPNPLNPLHAVGAGN